MNTQVFIKENSSTGNVIEMKTITDKNTQETRQIGSVMVQSETLTGLSRFARTSVRTAFLTLEQSAIDWLSGKNPDGIDYLVDGTQLPQAGHIVIKETLEPYMKKNKKPQDPKINPSTMKVITYKGKPVYRNSYFSEDFNEKDVFLKDTPVAVASTEDKSVQE